MFDQNSTTPLNIAFHRQSQSIKINKRIEEKIKKHNEKHAATTQRLKKIKISLNCLVFQN